jgi:hypothetical protein
MTASFDNAPSVGTQVEMRRPGTAGNSDFEPATVVDRLSDVGLGTVLELQFGDAWRMQRVWPSSTIRLVGS